MLNRIGDLFVSEKAEAFANACFDFAPKTPGVAERIDAILDELVFIEEKLQGKDVDCHAAYAAMLDLFGDCDALSDEGIDPETDAIIGEFYRDVIRGYYSNKESRAFVLRW